MAGEWFEDVRLCRDDGRAHDENNHTVEVARFICPVLYTDQCDSLVLLVEVHKIRP